MRSELLDGDNDEEVSVTEDDSQAKSDAGESTREKSSDAAVGTSENAPEGYHPGPITDKGQTLEQVTPEGNETRGEVPGEESEKEIHQVTAAVLRSTLAERHEDTDADADEDADDDDDDEDDEEEKEVADPGLFGGETTQKSDVTPADAESNGDAEDARRKKIAAACVLRGELPSEKQLCSVWLDEVIDALYEDLSEYMEWRLTVGRAPPAQR